MATSVRTTIGVALTMIAAVAPWVPPALARQAAWTPIGPPRGSFNVLLGSWSSLGTSYVANGVGDIWATMDGGVTWSYAGHASTYGGSLTAVHPAQSATIFWRSVAGIFRSIDGGVTWQEVLSGFAVTDVVISAAAPQTAYVLLADGGVRRSDDGGASWSRVGTIPQSFVFGPCALAIDPTAGRRLYLAGQPGVDGSTDGGVTWSPALSLAAPLPYDSVTTVLVAPSNPATLLFTSRPSDPSGAGGSYTRVWRSDDAGASWNPLEAGLPAAPQAVLGMAIGVSGAVYALLGDAADPTSPVQVFGEHGPAGSWQPLATLPAGFATLAVDFARPERLYALGSAGVLRSFDGGAEFALPEQAPSGVFVNQVLIGPGAAGSLYVAAGDSTGAEGGPSPEISTFNHSTDGGTRWTAAVPPFQTTFGGQAFVPFSLRLTLDAQPGTIYSLAYPSVEPPAHVSHDDGATWQVQPLPPFAELPLALAAEPNLPGKLVELGCPYTEQIIVPPLPSPYCTALRLYTTNTAGRHWNRVANLKLPAPVPSTGDLRLDPVTRTTIYVLFYGTLYKSTAAHPQLATLPLPAPIDDLAIDPHHPRVLYAAVEDPRRPLVKSTDGGGTWTNASTGLPRGVAVAALAIDPNMPTTVYAATDQGPFLTTDGAATWQPLTTEGLFAGVGFSTVTVSPATTPPTIYLGTVGAGVLALSAP